MKTKFLGFFKLNILTTFFPIILLLQFSGVILADDSYTVADVLSSQTQNASAISSMSSSVDGTTEYNGMTQNLSYDYQLSTDANGNNKIMISTKGIFTMQFLVDTTDMSVTFLMADGSQQKVTVTAETQTQIQQMAGISGSMMGTSGTLYASLGGKKGIVSDAAFASQLNKTSIETDDMIINVRGKRGSGKKMFGLINNDDISDVEYVNKKTHSARMKLDEALDKIKLSHPKTAAAERYKQNAIKWFAENGNKAMKTMISRRVEHINMRTGLVEEKEMYNADDEKVGHFKVKNKLKLRLRKKMQGNKLIYQQIAAVDNNSDTRLWQIYSTRVKRNCFCGKKAISRMSSTS